MILNLQNETWKDVKGYEGLYQVSSKGRIKSLLKQWEFANGAVRTMEEKLLVLRKDGGGYLRFWLFDGKGNRKNAKVHRMVAIHFLDNHENKREVNHKNGDKNDNNVENLEWNTPSENMQHAFRNKLISRPSGKDHYASKVVLNLETGIFYLSVKEAASSMNINYPTLRAKLNGGLRNNTSMILA